jgi:hypothetical protein
VTTWGEDPTDRMPTQRADHYPVHAHHERRGDNVGLALIVLLTFILGAAALLSAVFSLNATIDRLLAVPMCQEALP